MKNRKDNKSILAAGFSNFNEQFRFAKLLTIATIYQTNGDWEDQIIVCTKMYCNQEARKLKFPDGWQSCGSYELLKNWFFSNCVST